MRASCGHDRPRVAEVAERALQVLLLVRDARQGEEEGRVVGPRRGRRLQRLARQRELALPRVGRAERLQVGGGREPSLPEGLDHPDDEVVPTVRREHRQDRPHVFGGKVVSREELFARDIGLGLLPARGVVGTRHGQRRGALAVLGGQVLELGLRALRLAERLEERGRLEAGVAVRRLVAEDRLVRRERLARRARVLRRVLLVEAPEVEPRVRVPRVALDGLAEAPLRLLVAARRGSEDAEEVPDGRARRVDDAGPRRGPRAPPPRRRPRCGPRARQEIGERRRGLGRREEDQEGEDHGPLRPGRSPAPRGWPSAWPLPCPS